MKRAEQPKGKTDEIDFNLNILSVKSTPSTQDLFEAFYEENPASHYDKLSDYFIERGVMAQEMEFPTDLINPMDYLSREQVSKCFYKCNV